MSNCARFEEIVLNSKKCVDDGRRMFPKMRSVTSDISYLRYLSPQISLTSDVVFDDSRQAWANSEGTTLLTTLETLSQAVQDLQKRTEAQEKNLRDTNKRLENTENTPIHSSP